MRLTGSYAMHVNVGPFRYQVLLVRGYIRHEGADCLGLCDNIAQRILISDVPGESQRLQVFFHELMHAWWYHFGVDAADEEAVVDLVGVAMTDFLLQAVQQFRASFSEPSVGTSGAPGAPGDAGVPGPGDPGGGESPPEGPATGLPEADGIEGADDSDGGGVSTKRAPAVRTTAVRPAAAQLRGVIERMLPVLAVEVGQHAEECGTESGEPLSPCGTDRDEGWVISIYDRTSVGACRRPHSHPRKSPRTILRPREMTGQRVSG